MTRKATYLTTILAVVIANAGSVATAADELGRRASWSAPSALDVRDKVTSWLETVEGIDETKRFKINALWPEELPEMTGPELLEQVTATLALIEPRANEVVQFCRGRRSRFAPPEFAILTDDKAPPLVRHNLRLLFGRWLAQQQLYDESLSMLDGLSPEDVVDPASLLFYQGVAYHRVLDKDRCLPVLTQLLENEEVIPQRYVSVAKLMEADLKPLEADSLDEIARLMDAIRIELEHARAGTRVRQRQEEVLAKLDKLIDKLEQQRKQQQSQGGGGSPTPSSPLPDSQPAGGTGDGKVAPKKLGSKADWGNLPPKDREEALQQISKEFPSHFREVIEEYFRKLARDDEE